MEISSRILPLVLGALSSAGLLIGGGSALAGAGNGCTVLVSEPASLVLFLSGVGALAYLRHRRTRTRAKR
jgi:hypothetical protein